MAFPIAIFGSVLQILSMLPSLIQTAEQAFSGKGTGRQKKEFVTSALKTALDVTTSIAKVRELEQPGAKDLVLDAAGKLTDSVVASYNVYGYFKHGGDAMDVTASGGH